MRYGQNKTIEQEAQFNLELKRNFLDLIEILDSFDQLGRLAVILDQLYSPTAPEHPELFKALEKVAIHLRDLRAKVVPLD